MNVDELPSSANAAPHQRGESGLGASAETDVESNPAPASPTEDVEPVSDVGRLEALVGDLQVQLAAKEEAYQDVQGHLKRLAADFENFRRRQAQDREALVKSAGERVLEQFLEVLDNFERALQVGERATEPQQVLTGVQMIYKQVLDFLSKEGVVAMNAGGNPFDPNQHEAVLQEESDDQPDQTVLEEFRKGYTLHGKVLRHALVKIANNPAMPATRQSAANPEENHPTHDSATSESVS